MEDDKPLTVIFRILITSAGSETRPVKIITNILTPSFPEAALLTMGVSSAHKFLKWLQKKVYY